MKPSLRIRLIDSAAVVLAYFGFRFVTQAGQGLGVVQNDGYAMVGGFMILVAGGVLGFVISSTRNVKEKIPKRKDIKKSSEANLSALSDFANKLKEKSS